jgi:hypothetical protein
VQDAVAAAVEVERRDPVEAAQVGREHGRGLHPAAAQLERGEAVVAEHVAAQQALQARRGEVVAHVDQHEPARDAQRAQAGRVHDRLVDAEPAAALEHPAGAHAGPRQVGAVDLVAQPVANRVVELDRAAPRRARGGRDRGAHELLDGRRLVVEELGRPEQRAHGVTPSIEAILLRWISEVPE